MQRYLMGFNSAESSTYHSDPLYQTRGLQCSNSVVKLWFLSDYWLDAHRKKTSKLCFGFNHIRRTRTSAKWVLLAFGEKKYEKQNIIIITLTCKCIPYCERVLTQPPCGRNKNKSCCSTPLSHPLKLHNRIRVTKDHAGFAKWGCWARRFNVHKRLLVFVVLWTLLLGSAPCIHCGV